MNTGSYDPTFQNKSYGRGGREYPRRSGTSQFRKKQAPQEAYGGANVHQFSRNASMLRVVNFKKLAHAIGGTDILGSLLCMSTGRFAALEAGIEFTDEVAFHIETELNLPSGWLDQPNAELPENIFAKKDQGASNLVENSAKIAKGPTQAVEPQHAKKEEATTMIQAQPVQQATTPAIPAQMPANPAPAAQAAPAAAQPAERPDYVMRRDNLGALTSQPRTKTGLARLMGKKPANISHLMHGERNFTAEVAREIERAVGLPVHWFETPRQPEDVPLDVIANMLDDSERAVQAGIAFRQSVSSPAARAPRPAAPRKRAPAKAQAPAAPVVAPQEQAAPAPRLAAVPEQGYVPSVPSPTSLPHETTPVVSPKMEHTLRINEGKASDLAEALSTIILEKSRSGALSERMVWKMLSEVVNM